MIEQRLKEFFSMAYEKQILIFDSGGFEQFFNYKKLLFAAGFEVVRYDDVERFRYLYETEIKGNDRRFAVIVNTPIYVPYDIRKAFYVVHLSTGAVYPNLNAEAVSACGRDFLLIDFAYDGLYERCESIKETCDFIENIAWSRENVADFISVWDRHLLEQAQSAGTGLDWIDIARKNAQNAFYAAKCGISRSTEAINAAFLRFVMGGYQTLSGNMAKGVPAILPKTLDTVANGKVAVVIADGMSLFDFEVLARFLGEFDYVLDCSYAMIPTTTSVSRQSLLSGKYPREIKNIFSLSFEEAGFYEAAAARGYHRRQAFYGKGYDADPSPLVKLAAVIIREIDDMVHGQRQGREGMLGGMMLLAKSGKFQALVKRLLGKGFTVYLTSDHGNTECVGTGAIGRAGVETETKSKRSVVLKDFADVPLKLAEKAFQYPGYYMDKAYQYFICKRNLSFDPAGEIVMTHGGATIEEVIVPFVTFKGEKPHG